MSKKVCTKCGKPNKNSGSTWCNTCIAAFNREKIEEKARRGIKRKVIDVSSDALDKMGKGSKAKIERLVEAKYGKKK